MGLLNPQRGIDPLALGLLGAGSSIMSGRRGLAQAPMAFAQGLLQGQEAQAAQRAAAVREQMMREQADMRRDEFGMRREEFDARMADAAAAQQAEMQRREQLTRVRGQIEATRPELLPLFDLDPQGALKRMFPEDDKPQVVGPGAALVQGGREVFRNPAEQKPDEFERALRAAGIDPASPQAQQLARQRLMKISTHAPAPSQTVYTGTMVPVEGPDGRPRFVMPSRDGTVGDVPGLAPPGTAAADRARQTAQANALDTAQRMEKVAATALGKINRFSTGTVGRAMSNLPATDAKDLRAAIETLQANLSFEELRKMREASPTGGALGAVSEREITLLGATVANLDPNQSPEQLRQNLQIVQRQFGRVRELIQQGQTGGRGAATGEPATPASPRQFDALPPPNTLRGKTIRDDRTGQLLRSDGMRWVPVESGR